MKKINLKSTKGSITLYVLITVLFFAIILTLAYVAMSNKAQEQGEQSEIIEENYAKSIGSEETIYENMEIPLEPTITKADSTVTFSTAYGTIEVIWLEDDGYTVTETPNAPVLSVTNSSDETASLTPVKYNTNKGEFVETTSDDTSWYEYSAANAEGDYTKSRWANAITENGSYFVWIPRFAYRITYYEGYTTDDDGGNAIPTGDPTGYYDGYGLWDATTKTVKYELDEGIQTVEYNGKNYIVHPAFTTTYVENDDGTKTQTYDNGEWSEELKGFWVAKYEMSTDDNGLVASVEGTVQNDMSIGYYYEVARNANYGYETGLTIDTDGYESFMSSHMMKMSEWGAVAYLTHSQYGRNGTEVTPNDINKYSELDYVKQSSTGNEYGIYGLSGGVWEYVAAFNVEYDGDYYTSDEYGKKIIDNVEVDNDGNKCSSKYITKYTNKTSNDASTETELGTGKTGDATKEVNVNMGEYDKTNDNTSETAHWFSDRSRLLANPNEGLLLYPFFERGGGYGSGTDAGIFCSDGEAGYGVEHKIYGYRTVLCP